MSSATKGQKETRKGRLGLGTWPDAIAALVAVLTLLGTVINGVWGWGRLTGQDDRATVTTPAPADSPAPTAPSETSAPSPAGVSLAWITPVVGRFIPLPAGLDRAKYPHAVAVGCPSNQTGDDVTVLKYLLHRRYRVLSGTLTGWSAGREPFRVQLEVVTGTKQPDDQIQSERRPALTAVVNSSPVAVSTDITASGDAGRNGLGADEVELRFRCEHPHDAVILSGAQLGE